MIKLVAIDLDGTLLNSKKSISEANIQAVKEAIQAGVTVVVCSGRIYRGGRIFARQLYESGPIVACNGAVIRDVHTEEVFHDQPLDYEESCRIVEVCRKEGVYFHAYAGDTMYASEMGYGAAYYVNINRQLAEEDRVDIRLTEDFHSALQTCSVGASKFVIQADDPELLLRVRSKVGEIGNVEIVSSSRENFEVMRCGVSKGKSLEILAGKLGIRRDEIMAIGDNENDFSMIQYAGIGVAMGNAEEFIKDAAGYVTASNDEDGVARAIRKFVLPVV